MPAGSNPYYNPQYAEAAANIATAVRGDPEKMGAIAYRNAMTREAQLKGDRQALENNAVDTGLTDALTAGGTNPASYAAAMPKILGAMARGKISNPQNYLAPAWAITGESQSGASPAEAFVRSAYAGGGHAVPLDLALTPDRADQIRNDKALASQKSGKAAVVKTNDVDSVLSNIFSAIPGATEIDQYHRTHVSPDAADYFSKSGVLEPMRKVVSDTLRTTHGDQEAARDAVMEALQIPPGTVFDPAKRTHTADWIPFNDKIAPALVGPDENAISLDHVLQALTGMNAAPAAAPVTVQPQTMRAPGPGQQREANFGGPPPVIDPNVFAAPQAPVSIPRPPTPADLTPMAQQVVSSGGLARVNSPQEAMALPSGTRFMTPDGRIKVRP